MKKIIITTIILFTSVAFSGCFPSLEPNDMAVVQSVGIDKTEDGYKLTLQILQPGSTDSGNSESKIITSTGRTIAEAFSGATAAESGEIYYGHNRVLILGNEVVSQDIKYVFDFFNNSNQSGYFVNVFVSETYASDILIPEIIDEMTKSSFDIMLGSHQSGKGYPAGVIDVTRDLYNLYSDVAIPVVRVLDEDQKTIEIVGTAVFSDGVISGVVDSDITTGILIIKNELPGGVFTVKTENDDLVSLNLTDIGSTIDLLVQNNNPKFNINVSCSAYITEVIPGGEINNNEEFENEAVEILEQDIKNQVLDTLDIVVKQYQSDIFYLGYLLWQQDPGYFEGIKDDLKNSLKQADYEISVDISIDRQLRAN